MLPRCVNIRERDTTPLEDVMPAKYTREQRVRAFWAKVSKTDSCWLWTATLKETGYGMFSYRENGRHNVVRAHRYAWEITYGPIPAGMWVLHDCDVRACVRPSHLHLGDRPKNVAEAVERKRVASGARHWVTYRPNSIAKGERNGHAKMTAEQVLAARRRYAAGGILQRELAAEYGVTRETMRSALRGKNWKHL